MSEIDETFHSDKISPVLLKAAMDDFVRAANVIATIKKSILDGGELPENFETSVRARAYNTGLMPRLEAYVKSLSPEGDRGITLECKYPPETPKGYVTDTQLFRDIFRLSEEAGHLMDTLQATVFRGTPVTPETFASANWRTE